MLKFNMMKSSRFKLNGLVMILAIVLSTIFVDAIGSYANAPSYPFEFKLFIGFLYYGIPFYVYLCLLDVLINWIVKRYEANKPIWIHLIAQLVLFVIVAASFTVHDFLDFPNSYRWQLAKNLEVVFLFSLVVFSELVFLSAPRSS